ncbi:MAG TPA: hypothetical protein VJI67_03415 [archaeon]|nr:hypothetical protein [archaeon]HLD80414.1 hypothetical protein [archaeon]
MSKARRRVEVLVGRDPLKALENLPGFVSLQHSHPDLYRQLVLNPLDRNLRAKLERLLRSRRP